MITVLAFSLFVAAAPITDYSAWTRSNEVHIRFSNLNCVYGPLKIYVSPTASPAAGGCSSCPMGEAATYIVPSGSIYQSWPQGGRYLEATFPTALVGGLESFYFTAVSCVPGDERYLCSGVMQASVARK